MSWILYKMQFIRALLKYKSGNYFPAYCLLRSALKYAPPDDHEIRLFGAYLAILAEREDLACAHVVDYYSVRGHCGSVSPVNRKNESEELWIKAFAQYLYLACVEFGSIERLGCKELEVIDLERIRFDKIRVLYKKMFPFDHAVEIGTTFRRYGLISDRENQ